MRNVMEKADALLAQNPVPSAEALAAFDAELTSRNISPGGSADLLALCSLLRRNVKIIFVIRVFDSAIFKQSRKQSNDRYTRHTP